MKTFNSMQIVAAFIGWPFLISWLSEATFRGNSVAFYSSIIAYFVSYLAMVGCTRMAMDEKQNGVWWW